MMHSFLNKVFSISAILVLLSLSPFLTGHGYCAESSELIGFDIIAENSSLILYFNKTNTEFAIQQRNTGNIWYSNPPNRQEDKIARGEMLGRLHAQLMISYYTPGDRLMYMNNYTDSILYNQFNIELVENGVRVEYLFGKQWDDSAFLPVMIEKDCFESILNNISNESDRHYLRSNYTLMQLVEADANVPLVTVSQVDVNAVFGKYTLIDPANEDLTTNQRQRMISTLLDQIVTNRGDLHNKASITSDHIPAYLHESAAYVLNTNLLPWDEADIINILMGIGYDPEITHQQHEKYNIDAPMPNPQVFWIPIEYRLEGDNFIVDIDAAEIEYPIAIPNSEGDGTDTFPLYQINVLEFFGAAYQGELGYIFVPDGSGGLINLHRQPQDHGIYERPVYGEDLTISGMNSQMRIANLEVIRLPVYGIKKADQAMVAIIEQGDAFANISVNLAGRVNSYSSISPLFTIIPNGQATLQGSVSHRVRYSAINIYQERPYQGHITLRYSFLDGDDADYVGMAKQLRNYLINRGKLHRLSGTPDIPLLIDIIGGVAKQQSVLGVPVEIIEPMTSYQQIVDIVRQLKAHQISSLSLRLLGWMQGGLEHKFPNQVNLEAKLGTAEDFSSMADYLKQNQVSLFPEVDFLNVYRNGVLDGFSTHNDAARFLSGKVAKIPQAKFTNLTLPNRSYFLLSPGILENLVHRFLQDYQDFGFTTLSASTLGSQLNSDFKKQQLIHRQQTLAAVETTMANIRDSGIELIVSGGNMYALPYAKNIINAPAQASPFAIIDQSVPFFQLVVHGFHNYAYQPLNLADDPKWLMLKTIETGAMPYYALSYQPSALVKSTDFDCLYATYYQDWTREIVGFYERVNLALAGTSNQAIIDHQELVPNVFLTSYEKGLAVIVNYNKLPVEVHGRTVAGEDFITYFEVEENED